MAVGLKSWLGKLALCRFYKKSVTFVVLTSTLECTCILQIAGTARENRTDKASNSFTQHLITPGKTTEVTKVPRKKALNYKAQVVTRQVFESRKTDSVQHQPDPVRVTSSSCKSAAPSQDQRQSSTKESWFCVACTEDFIADMRKCIQCDNWVHEECIDLDRYENQSKKEASQTGGGPSSAESLNEIDDKVLEIMGLLYTLPKEAEVGEVPVCKSSPVHDNDDKDKENLCPSNIKEKNLKRFPNLSQTSCQEDDVSTYVQHLNALYSDFESRFEDILTMVIPPWIINPYGDIEETNVIIQEELN
ncbi:unnamed protein product [Acanthoscelides obtectus]|uniref:Uncharacterized protein n=1 Tax=Acanthoscelides obtectus TaxID=200917 RepID=A0A9P0PZX5_ACAOB|nr:unnamed protein product [Acanthoscelides obtectus]CAK1682804.1 hypothetical protein AOBTE_LOCUS33897 [Acanthoscelides obtectus]